MVTAGSVLVFDIDVDLLAKRATSVELHVVRVSDQFRGDVNLHSVLADHPVWSEVLSFEMHVDRHVIFGASSTNGRDEVDCDDPALLLDQRGGVFGNEEFHDFVTP